MDRLVAYYRVSSKSQEDNTSLEYQKARVHDWASRNNVSIIKEYEEVCSATGRVERPKFLAALSEVAQDECDGMIVLDLDRFFRNAADGMMCFQKHFREADKRLVSIQQQFDTSTAEGWLVFAQFLCIAEYVCLKDVRKMQAGKEWKRENGGYTGGKPPYGYDAEGAELVENEEEQKNIGWMAAMREEGKTYSQIADELNYYQTPTKSGKGSWGHSQVARVLQKQKENVA